MCYIIGFAHFENPPIVCQRIIQKSDSFHLSQNTIYVAQNKALNASLYAISFYILLTKAVAAIII